MIRVKLFMEINEIIGKIENMCNRSIFKAEDTWQFCLYACLLSFVFRPTADQPSSFYLCNSWDSNQL